MIPLSYLLILSAILFGIGWAGLILRRNFLTLLMSIELFLNAANLAFISFARYQGNIDGQVLSLFVMTIAACEAVIGLAIAIVLFRHRKNVNTDDFTELRG